MDLTLSGEQKQLVESFAALYARESPTERVRAAEPLGFDAKLWQALREIGVLEMAHCPGPGGEKFSYFMFSKKTYFHF